MGILKFRIFRIRILKDSNSKPQFISNNWNWNENTLALTVDNKRHHLQSFSLYIRPTFETAFQKLFLSSLKGNVQIYHMTLREGEVKWLSEYRYKEGSGLAKSSYKFYSG